MVGLVLVNNHPQIWEKDFRFVGTNDLDLGGGAVLLGSGVGGRVVTVSAGNLRVGGVIADGVASGLGRIGARDSPLALERTRVVSQFEIGYGSGSGSQPRSASGMSGFVCVGYQ